MEALFLIAVLVGALLGLRFKALVLAPASVVVAALAAVIGIVTARKISGVVALDIIGVLAALQAGYLLSSLATSKITSKIPWIGSAHSRGETTSFLKPKLSNGLGMSGSGVDLD